MDYWKSKVLPKMKLIFVKTSSKKAAAEVVKAFDESKEGINGEFEEKKADLQPKVVEIYESVTAPVKILIKERKKTSAIKKNSAPITKLLEDLAKIEFPGAKQVSEGIATVGPALLSGPIFATFEKVSTLLPATATEGKEQSPKEEEKKDEAAAATEEKKEEAAAEEKKEEATAAVAEEAVPAAAAAEPAAAAAAEETSSSAAPPSAQAAPEAATPAETESAPAKAEEAPKAA